MLGKDLPEHPTLQEQAERDANVAAFYRYQMSLTPVQAAYGPSGTLGRLAAANRNRAISMLVVAIIETDRSIASKAPLSDESINEIAEWILNNHSELKLDEVVYVLGQGKASAYKQFYGVLSLKVVSTWFAEYWEEKLDAAAEYNEALAGVPPEPWDKESLSKMDEIINELMQTWGSKAKKEITNKELLQINLTQESIGKIKATAPLDKNGQKIREGPYYTDDNPAKVINITMAYDEKQNLFTGWLIEDNAKLYPLSPTVAAELKKHG
jgi:hypothetical protein